MCESGVKIFAESEQDSSKAEEAAYEAALCAALQGPTKQAAVAPPPSPAAPPSPTSADSLPDRVLIPAAVYPKETCTENGGEGWTAILLSASKHTFKLAFPNARDDTGAPFAPVRLPKHCVAPHP